MQKNKPPEISIIDAMGDPQLFERWFRGRSWDAWKTFLRVLFGLPVTGNDLERYQTHTQRPTAPTIAFSECWLVVGRRGGKSLVASLIAVFLACFRDYSAYLQAGEVGTIALIAADRKQTRTLLRYVRGFLSVPMLKKMIVADTSDGIELSNRVVIEIHTASWRSVRGYTLLAVIADEIAFWRTEDSANPDKEILNAVRPGLATIPSSLLLCISSPYARRGELWNAYSRHFSKDHSEVLVWQGASRDMNPSLRQSVIDRAMEEDEPAARAEYFAEFRRDVESFIDALAAKALVVPGRLELPPNHRVRYFGFVDPAGGSGRDSYALAIGHGESNSMLVLDCVRERRPPFSPAEVTQEFSTVLKGYGVSVVCGDRYAGEWPREAFGNQSIRYIPSDKSKSELYKNALPLLNSGRVQLLDNPRLVNQLCGLERRTSRGGNDSIDHTPNGHDDIINSVCGVLMLLIRPQRRRPRVLWGIDIYGNVVDFEQRPVTEQGGAVSSLDHVASLLPQTPGDRPSILDQLDAKRPSYLQDYRNKFTN